MTPAQQLAFWADQLRDITANGHRFANNPYDRENYERIRQIAIEMTALATGDSLADLEPLRDTIFSHPTPISTGDAAIIDKDGRILLIRRADSKKWAMPGGALSVGETPAEGAVREALEETGIHCEAVALVGIFDSRFVVANRRHQLYMQIYLCRPLEHEPTAPASHVQEVLEIGWFSEAELPADLDPGHSTRIPYVFRFWRGEVGAYWDGMNKSFDV